MSVKPNRRQMPNDITVGSAQVLSASQFSPSSPRARSTTLTRPKPGLNSRIHTMAAATVGVTTGRKNMLRQKDLPSSMRLLRKTASTSPRKRLTAVTTSVYSAVTFNEFQKRSL